MKNTLYSILFFLIGYFNLGYGQELPYNTDATFIGDATPSVCDGTSGGVVHITNGDYITVSAIEGNTYTFDFCNELFDSQMDIWSTGGTSYHASNDDACGPNGLQSQIVWTATITGIIEVHIAEWYCLVDRHWATQPLTVTCTGDAIPCLANISLSGATAETIDYATDGFIQSSQQILAGALVDYDSGTEIDLLPNFEVQLGAIFCTIIDGCNGGLGGGIVPLSNPNHSSAKSNHLNQQ